MLYWARSFIVKSTTKSNILKPKCKIKDLVSYFGLFPDSIFKVPMLLGQRLKYQLKY